MYLIVPGLSSPNRWRCWSRQWSTAVHSSPQPPQLTLSSSLTRHQQNTQRGPGCSSVRVSVLVSVRKHPSPNSDLLSPWMGLRDWTETRKSSESTAITLISLTPPRSFLSPGSHPFYSPQRCEGDRGDRRRVRGSTTMEPACRKDKPKLNSTPTRGDRAKQKSAQQELKQRQRAEIYALNKVMTELEQQQFEAFCKQMQSQGEELINFSHYTDKYCMLDKTV
ncbi:hypothetical protein INR49_016791 [Caranx melampygus]|nr:hypothetical protein INR49_016791 [Caranx melampygus]